MRKNNFLKAIMLMLIMLLTLTSCESLSKNSVTTDIKYEIAEANGEKVIKYKVLLNNSTIYNFKDVSFSLELYDNDTSVLRLLDYEGDAITIEHGKGRLIEGEKVYNGVEFTEIRVVDYKYTPLSFYDTYKAFIILMPILTIIISGVVVYVLLKNEASKPDTSRTSVVGLFGLFAMLAMINYVGWVPILSMFIAAAIIFLSGCVAVVIKKHRYVPQEVLDAMKNEGNNEVIDVEAENVSTACAELLEDEEATKKENLSDDNKVDDDSKDNI